MFYKHILRPILFKIDPELVHDFFVVFGEFLGRYGLTRYIVRLLYGNSILHPELRDNITQNIGVTPFLGASPITLPILLAAGFDYNGRLTRILPCIGLDGVEIGSVTARQCSGNNKPRLKRLPFSQSIIVNKGLKNDGVDAIIKRLRKLDRRGKNLLDYARQNNFIIGVSIARTNDPESAGVESGIADYAYSFRRLSENFVGDYYTINISCPNAFGGESFANSPELLDKLLGTLMKIPHPISTSDNQPKPVYVKMSINLSWEKFEKLLEIIERHGLQGVVIGNLNKDYNYIDERDERPKEYVGGLSGVPCTDLSNDLILKTRTKFGYRFTIIGCGGIMSKGDLDNKIKAGADSVQIITGLIYKGPGLIKELTG